MSEYCNIVDLDRLILESKVAEINYGAALKTELFDGETCDVHAQEKILQLQTYRYYLEEEYQTISFGGEPCLSSEELQCLFERVNKLTTTCDTINRPDLIIDESGKELWLAQNPYCVSRETWEYLAYDILCDLQLEVDIINKTEVCDIAIEITTEVIPCDITIVIDQYHKLCDIGFEVSAKAREQCNISFEALTCNKDCEIALNFHTTVRGCPIDVDQYEELIDENLSPEMITAIYESGSCLSIDEGEVMLHTQNGEYSLNSLKFKDTPDIQSLQKYGVNVEDSKYLKDPDTFIKTLNKNYSGNN